MDLYLPESWAEDRARCRAAHIPDDVGYRPKRRIALDLIERNVAAGVPLGLLLADSAYGDVGAFRDGVRALDFEYALDVKSHTRVVIVCDDGEETDPMDVETVADIIGAKRYRKVTWRQGSRRALAARFATVRVRVVTGRDVRGEEQWLVIERPSRSAPPEHYVLAPLPKSMSRKELVRRIKQRWRTERTYEDLKGELGLDHFEGRTYTGWQHHVSCTLACFAFLVAERARVSPPGDRTDASRRPDRARGLNATFTTPSSPSGWPSPVPSSDGCRDVRAASPETPTFTTAKGAAVVLDAFTDSQLRLTPSRHLG